MQSDSSEADPRLKREHTGPTIATGIVDPCLIYLEATLHGEIPLLGICWASSAQQVRDSGKDTYLNLGDIIVLRGSYTRTARGVLICDGKPVWNFTLRREKSLTLQSKGRSFHVHTSDGIPFLAPLTATKKSQHYAFRGEIHFLDQVTHTSFQKLWLEPTARNTLATNMLSYAGVAWPSVSDALMALRTEKVRNTPSREQLKYQQEQASQIREIVKKVQEFLEKGS
jgi:hypothetical protein